MGASYGPAPYYGELEYSGRMQLHGFALGERENFNPASVKN